jgi:hypothetical protein
MGMETMHTDDKAIARRKAKLEQYLAEYPRWYNPWAHLAGTTGVGIVVLVLAILNLHGIRPLELLIVPATFLFANAFEWWVHRNVLHRRFPLLKTIYEKHTPMHHGVYVTEDMEIASTREFRMILIPAVGVLSIVLFTAPLAWGLAWLTSANVGWLFLLTSSLYLVSYELSHLAYHLPRKSFIGRLKLIGLLRRQHARHHDPALMQEWNFNVTVPLFDWILRTNVPADKKHAD